MFPRSAARLCCASTTLLLQLVGSTRMVKMQEGTSSFIGETDMGVMELPLNALGMLEGASSLIEDIETEFINFELPPNATVGAVICSKNLSNVWLSHRLLNYSLPNLYEVLCDEPLMVLVQSEILRMRRLSALWGEEKFGKKFPESYAKKEAWKTAVQGAAMTSLKTFSFVPVPELAHLVESISSTSGSSLYTLGSFWMNKRLQMEESIKRLVDGGGDAHTEVWADVVSGVLWNNYRKIQRLWYSSEVVDLDNFTLMDPQTVEKVNGVWRSPVSMLLKLLASWGLLAGSLLVGGPVFPILGIAIGAASTTVDTTLTVKVFQHMTERIAFILAGMAQWERGLFLNPPKGTNFCDRETCPLGFTCMRHGVFHCLEDSPLPENSSSEFCKPVCVRAPAPPGNSSSKCSVGTSCESGICNFPSPSGHGRRSKTEDVVQLLIGSCAELS